MAFIDHDLHIHTELSSCSRDPEQNAAFLLSYAQRNNLKTICVTDHFWDETVPGASNWYKPRITSTSRKSFPFRRRRASASSSAARPIWTNTAPSAYPRSA